MLERDYTEVVHPATLSRVESTARVCSLPPQVQFLLNTICSIAMMKTAMTEIG